MASVIGTDMVEDVGGSGAVAGGGVAVVGGAGGVDSTLGVGMVDDVGKSGGAVVGVIWVSQADKVVLVAKYSVCEAM